MTHAVRFVAVVAVLTALALCVLNVLGLDWNKEWRRD